MVRAFNEVNSDLVDKSSIAIYIVNHGKPVGHKGSPGGTDPVVDRQHDRDVTSQQRPNNLSRLLQHAKSAECRVRLVAQQRQRDAASRKWRVETMSCRLVWEYGALTLERGNSF